MAQSAAFSITIVDPVAYFSYAIDPETKTAWRTPSCAAATAIMQKMQAMEEKQKVEQDQLLAAKKEAEARQREGGAGFGRRHASGEVVVRTRGGNVAMAYAPEPGPIEHKVIEGVNVDGRKTTTTIGLYKVGNEQRPDHQLRRVALAGAQRARPHAPLRSAHR